MATSHKIWIPKTYAILLMEKKRPIISVCDRIIYL